MPSSITSVSAISLEKVIELSDKSTEKKEEKKTMPVTSMKKMLRKFSTKLTPTIMEKLHGKKSKLVLWRWPSQKVNHGLKQINNGLEIISKITKPRKVKVSMRRNSSILLTKSKTTSISAVPKNE